MGRAEGERRGGEKGEKREISNGGLSGTARSERGDKGEIYKKVNKGETKKHTSRFHPLFEKTRRKFGKKEKNP